MLEYIRSFVVGRSNMGTERDMGDDRDGDCCRTGRDAIDGLVERLRMLITGDEDDFSLVFVGDELCGEWATDGFWNTFEVII